MVNPFKWLWNKIWGRKPPPSRDAMVQVGKEFPIGTPFPVRAKKK